MEAGPEKAVASTPPPRGRWRRVRRILLLAGGAVLLLIILLPTLLTILPLESIAARAINGRINGRVEIEGFRIGWIRAPGLRSIRLYEDPGADARLVFALDDFHARKGLLSILFSGARAGRIDVERIELNARRDADGTINLLALVPPSPEAEKPEKPAAKPLELELDKLIPTFPLPLSSLSIHANRIDAAWLDLASSPTMDLRLVKGRFDLEWAGTGQPLTVAFAGDVASPTQTLPVAARWELARWESQGRTALIGSALEGGLYAGNPSLPLLTTSLAIEPTRVDARLGLHPANARPLASLAAPRAPYPVEGGTIGLDLYADFADAREMTAQADLALRGLVLAQYGRDGGPLTVPDHQVEASTRLDKKSLKPGTSRLLLTGSLLSAEATATPGNGDAMDAALRVDLETARLIAYLRTTRFDSDAVPDVDGRLTLQASATLQEMKPARAQAELAWDGQSLRWRSTDAFPPSFQPLGETLDLEPTDFRLVAVMPGPDGRQETARVTLENALVQARINGLYADPSSPSGDLRLDADLEGLFQYVADHFSGVPVDELVGRMELRASGGIVDGSAILTSGTLALGGLAVTAPSIPFGTYRDDLRLGWGVRIDRPEGAIRASSITLDSQYLELDLLGRFVVDGPFDGNVYLLIRTAALQRDILPHFIDPEVLSAEGDINLMGGAKSDRPGSYEGGLGLFPARDFSISAMGDVYTLDEFQFLVDGTVELRPDEYDARLRGMKLSLGSCCLDVWAEGQAAGRGSETTASLKMEADLKLGAMLERLAPVLEARGMTISSEKGAITLGLDASGIVRQDEAGLIFPEPAVVEARLMADIPALSAEGGFGAVEVEDFALNHEVEAILTSTDPAGVAIIDDGTITVGVYRHGTMAEVPEIALDSRIEVAGNRAAAVEIRNLSIGEPLVATETMELQVPPTSFSGRLMVDLGEGRYTAEDLRLVMEDTLEAKLAAALDNTTSRTLVAASGAIHDLSSVSVVLLKDGEPLEFSVNGRGSGSLTLDANLRDLQADLMNPWKAAEANLNATWSEWTADYASRYTMDRMDGSLDLTLDAQGLQTQLSTTVDGYAIHRANIPEQARRLNLSAGAVVSPDGSARMDDTALSLPDMGTTLRLSGGVEDWPGALRRNGDPAAASQRVRRLLGETFDLRLAVDQELSPLAGFGGVTGASGRAVYTLSLDNSPDGGLTASLQSDMDSVSASSGGAASLQDLIGSLDLMKHWRAGEDGARGSDVLGSFTVAGIDTEIPAAMPVARKGSATVRLEETSLLLGALVESLLGGPADLGLETTLEGDTIQVRGDVALTRIDGSLLLPGLARRDIGRRTMNVFGNIGLDLPPDPTMRLVAERAWARLEVTDIGSELLREYLRVLDAGGSNPGIQAALATLAVSRPDRVVINLRNGLLTVGIVVVNPAGVRFTVPVFDRLRVAPLVAANLPGGLDPMLVLIREAVRIASLETTGQLAGELDNRGSVP